MNESREKCPIQGVCDTSWKDVQYAGFSKMADYYCPIRYAMRTGVFSSVTKRFIANKIEKYLEVKT